MINYNVIHRGGDYMTIEDELKEYILSRYQSLREFTQSADMSYSTVDSVLKRGVGNSSVNTIIKICKVLGISVDALADGKITPINTYESKPGLIEMSDILEDVKNQLIQRDITINGKPADRESINSIVQAITIGEHFSKQKP